MFDFSDLKEAMSGLESNLDAINQHSIDTAAKENERRERVDAAIVATAKATDRIRGGLEIETEKRELADAENMKYTKRWDKINLTVALLALAVAVAGLVVAIVK